MTVKELIYRLKDFPMDAVIGVRGRNKHHHAAVVKVSSLGELHGSTGDEADADGQGAPVRVVRLVGAEG